jgi:hypothetical protein
MSKLTDRIRRAGKAEPAPFGFATGAAVARTTSATILVVVRLPGNDAGKIADAASKGADVVILEGGAAKLRDAKSTGDVIIGVKLDKPGRKEAAAAREAGADFLLIDEATAADTLLDEKLGFVISASIAFEDTRLRLLGDLALDAILVEAPSPPLTVGSVLDLRRIAGLGRAPLLVEASPDIDASSLQVIRDSGAAGVVISDAGKLGQLRETLTSLPLRGRPREEEHREALVPASAQTGGHDDDDDYDD